MSFFEGEDDSDTKEVKETNLLDDTEVIDVEEEDSLEDIELISMGLNPKYFEEFRERYPKKNIFYPPTKIFAENLTKFAFKFYLGKINNEEVKDIKLPKLPEDFDELVIDLIKRGETKTGKTEPVNDKREGIIAQYIEKNAELIKDLDASKKIAKEYINLHAEGKEYIEKHIKHIKFLYVMNGKMLRMLLENEIPFPIAPEELEVIGEIKEVIE